MVVGQGHVTRFATIGTVVQPIGAQANLVLAFADGAIPFAGAILLALVTLHAYDLLVFAGHARLQKALYLRRVCPASAACGVIYNAARAAAWRKATSTVGGLVVSQSPVSTEKSFCCSIRRAKQQRTDYCLS